MFNVSELHHQRSIQQAAWVYHNQQVSLSLLLRDMHLKCRRPRRRSSLRCPLPLHFLQLIALPLELLQLILSRQSISSGRSGLRGFWILTKQESQSPSALKLLRLLHRLGYFHLRRSGRSGQSRCHQRTAEMAHACGCHPTWAMAQARAWDTLRSSSSSFECQRQFSTAPSTCSSVWRSLDSMTKRPLTSEGHSAEVAAAASILRR